MMSISPAQKNNYNFTNSKNKKQTQQLKFGMTPEQIKQLEKKLNALTMQKQSRELNQENLNNTISLLEKDKQKAVKIIKQSIKLFTDNLKKLTEEKNENEKNKLKLIADAQSSTFIRAGELMEKGNKMLNEHLIRQKENNRFIEMLNSKILAIKNKLAGINSES